MDFRRIVICGAAALFAATAAQAADAVVEEVAVVDVAPEWNFSGAYIGVHGGYGWAQGDAQYADDEFNEECGIFYGCAVSLDPDGAFGGVQAGYNYQFSNGFVLGVEGDWSYASLEDNGIGSWAGGSQYTDVDLKIKQMATVQARFGYAMGRWMPFATVGWGWAEAERQAFNDDFLNPPSNEKNWHNGWTAGVGAEYAIDQNWTVKGEYRYFDGGEETYLGFAGGTEIDLKVHTLRVGLNYGF